ncbi:MAG: single-stranded DNA-binding protein [Ignavibacteriae bacterium]|nr:single-stranded DNA-binding protein [Ignavibacteria bacterium]MBI3365224.1 single-stranded DNA-binding protein [Ignavibacteriota bacterium]
MADLKMPELNSVVIAGNLTKDPIFRQTTNGTPVVNFSVASNRKYRDANNQWQEEVCYVGVVAWNKLAESCANRLKKGSAVLIDGELQSHVFKSDDGHTRNIVEIKARHIQFLNKKGVQFDVAPAVPLNHHSEDEPTTVEDDSFDKFLTSEEAQLLKEQSPNPTHRTQG